MEESGNGSQALQVCPKGGLPQPWLPASVEESGQRLRCSVLGWSEGRGLGEEQWAELGSRPRCHFLIGVPVVPATHLHPPPPRLSPRPGAQPRAAGRGGL